MAQTKPPPYRPVDARSQLPKSGTCRYQGDAFKAPQCHCRDGMWYGQDARRTVGGGTGSSKDVLVLVPSLTLLQQTLRGWSEQTSWDSSFSYICVCSDPTVGLKDDAINADKSEVGFRIDTNPLIIQQLLERKND